jgi:GrpB-like predicted nucleotidyltransferase (UPF0157 family)
VNEEQLRAVTVGELTLRNAPVQLDEYDPRWPLQYQQAAAMIRLALGDRVLQLEHVGSTSVPGLAAKPRIDIVLAVADSADESAYVPPLEAVGYTMRIREPHWWQHRMLSHRDPDQNVHVFTRGCPEVERMIGFRDWLRSHDDDRQRYEDAKRTLAARTWKYMQNYADAKTDVVEAIIERAGLPAGLSSVSS